MQKMAKQRGERKKRIIFFERK